MRLTGVCHEVGFGFFFFFNRRERRRTLHVIFHRDGYSGNRLGNGACRILNLFLPIYIDF